MAYPRLQCGNAYGASTCCPPPGYGSQFAARSRETSAEQVARRCGGRAPSRIAGREEIPRDRPRRAPSRHRPLPETPRCPERRDRQATGGRTAGWLRPTAGLETIDGFLVTDVLHSIQTRQPRLTLPIRTNAF